MVENGIRERRCSETNIVVDNVEMFRETIADMKQNKARSKTVFTKTRRCLLVIQEIITVEFCN